MVVLWAILVAVLGGCSPAALPPPGSPPRPARRILLVVVDTLRADHLSLYGHPRETAPVLRARAATARVFTQARSPAPWTLPAARALLGADHVHAFDPADTVAVRLQAAGWRTVLLSANPNLSAPFGFDAGWDRAELHEKAPATDQVDRARAERGAHPDQLFVLLHLMDPHLPYDEPPALRGRFAGPPPTARLADPLVPPVLSAAFAAAPPTAAEQAHLADRYDQTILAVDTALARLWPLVGPDDLVVFVSDHGESLGEDGLVGHGHSLDEALVRVPLLVWGPGLAPGESSGAVGLDDGGATVLAAAGLAPAPGRSGRDLRGPLAADRPQLLSHTHQGLPRFGVVDGDQRWVSDGTAPAPGLAAAWARGGGPPLVAALRVAWAGIAPPALPEAPPGVTGIQLRGGATTGPPWTAPAPLQPAPARAQSAPDTWQLVAPPMARLPGVVYQARAPGAASGAALPASWIQRGGAWERPAPGALTVAPVVVPPAGPGG